MNTFDDAKKAKWITKYIAKRLKLENTTVRFASLFLESDEDPEVYEDVENFSVNSEFSELVLFEVIIKNDLFRIKLVMQDSEKGFWIHCVRYNKGGEEENDGIDIVNEDWKNVLDLIDRFVSYPDGLSLEQSYEELLKKLFKKD